MITKIGKLQQMKLLAGETNRFADYFTFGASTGVPGSPELDEESKTLKVGWGACPITGTYIDEANGQVIYYATVPQSLSGLIGEIGLLTLNSDFIKQDKPSSGSYFFSEGEDWSFEGEIEYIDGETGQVRLGNRSILVDSEEPVRAILQEDIDLATFDELVILGDTSSPISIRFYSGEADYAERIDIELSAMEVYSIPLDTLMVSGNFDKTAVRAIVIEFPAGNHVLDGFVFRDTNYGNLVAGSEVEEPFYKSAGSNLEIEYAVKI